MIFDRNKIQSGQPYPLPSEIVLAEAVRVKTGGVTAFQDIDPYNDYGYDAAIPYAYRGHSGVDLRCEVGTPVYAVVDLTLRNGGSQNDKAGFYVEITTPSGAELDLCHLREPATKTSFKAGELVCYSGMSGNVPKHLHADLNNGWDMFANISEYTGTTTPPPVTEAPAPTSGAKTFKATRSGKSKYNGTFYFDEKYYEDFKDGKQEYDAVDTNGDNWVATTTWTTVEAPTGGSSKPSPSPTFGAKYVGSKSPADTGKTFSFQNADRDAFPAAGKKGGTTRAVKDTFGDTWGVDSTFQM